MSPRLVLSLLVPLALAAAPAVAADGKAVFDAQCARCHGPDGKGDTAAGKAMKVPSMIDPKLAAADAIPTIKSSFEANPKHSKIKGKVSPEELDAVAAYVNQLAKGGS